MTINDNTVINENDQSATATCGAYTTERVSHGDAREDLTSNHTEQDLEEITYHKLKPIMGKSADLPRNPKDELFIFPQPSGDSIMFDITAMNEYWNALEVDYNAYTDLYLEPVQEWFDDGYLWLDRVNRFIDTVSRNQANGIVTRFRPLLAVTINGDVHLIDGRHRYAAMLLSHWNMLDNGRVPCLPTYVFLEDEWKQFVVTDERVNTKLTVSGS